jgi:hypothetical protein
MLGVNDEFDAMINVSGVGASINCDLSDENIFEEYLKVQTTVINTNILMTHFATQMLCPNGYIAYPGEIEIFKRKMAEK